MTAACARCRSPFQAHEPVHVVLFDGGTATVGGADAERLVRIGDADRAYHTDCAPAAWVERG